jgi:signal transduction histidine kinase
MSQNAISTPDPCALDEVLITSQLSQRRARPPDFQAENAALIALFDALTESPSVILQKLVETSIQLTGADTAGISVLESQDGREIFRWHAVAGEYGSLKGSILPRSYSPCGTVLDRNSSLLMDHPATYFTNMIPINPQISEVLLVPFYQNDKAIGTIWVIAHREDKRFDAEDARVVTSLSKLASIAVQTLKSLDDARAASSARDRFLAVLSHELRTPLSPVVMAVAAMQQNPDLTPTLREDVEMIRRNLDLQTRLIDDMLDVSRVMSGKLRLQMQPTRIHHLLKHTLEICASDLNSKQLHLQFDLVAAADQVCGDPARLQQVFWNLMKNAIKFSPEGADIHIRTSNPRPGSIRVQLQDSGIGIDPHRLLRIFDAFEQGDASAAGHSTGLGLGLSISKSIIDRHGGTIQAASDGPGKGSTFTVELDNSDHFPSTSNQRLPVDEQPNTAQLLLAVEDHRNSAKVSPTSS